MFCLKTKDDDTARKLAFLEDEKANGDTIEYVELLWSLMRSSESFTQLKGKEVDIHNACVLKTRALGANVSEEFVKEYERFIVPVCKRIPSLTLDRTTYEQLTCEKLVTRTLGIFATLEDTMDPPGVLVAAKLLIMAFKAFSYSKYKESAHLFEEASTYCKTDYKVMAKDTLRFSYLAFAYHHYLTQREYERSLDYLRKAAEVGWERDYELIQSVSFGAAYTLRVLQTEKDPEDTERPLISINALSANHLPPNHTFKLL